MWGYILLTVAIVLLIKLFYGDSEPQYAPVSDSKVYTHFTPRSLAKYNGLEGERVLLAVKGKVYDVTSGKQHYGPGGMYENFAGRDASRGLAKHSFDVDMLTPLDQPPDELKDLTEEEKAALDHWAGFFASKYECVGDFKLETE